jgi:hypothetical protein
MKGFKVSQQDKRLVMVLLSVAVLAAAYFLVFHREMQEAQKIEASNVTDSQRVDVLQNKAAGQEDIIAETEDFRQDITDMLEKYPADVTEEKAITILQDMERQQSTDFKVVQMGFVTDNPVGAGAAGTEETDTTDTAAESAASSALSTDNAAGDSFDIIENASQAAGGYLAVTVDYEASYQGLKQVAAAVHAYQDRMALSSITATYDSDTGKLSGTLALNMYYIRLAGKEYVTPQIDKISKGVTNLFK